MTLIGEVVEIIRGLNDLDDDAGAFIVLEHLNLGAKHAQLRMPTLHCPVEAAYVLVSPQVSRIYRRRNRS